MMTRAQSASAQGTSQGPSAQGTSQVPSAQSTVPSQAVTQIPSTQNMTQDQSNQLFEIARQTALTEQNAAAANFQLEQEIMRNESAARIAALATPSSVNPVESRRHLDEEDDELGEIPLEARSIIHRFPSLPKEDIIRIFRNRFRPVNLFRLHHMRGIRHDALQR